MSGVVTATVGTAAVGAYMSDKAAGEAADSARAGAQLTAQGEREALEYQKSVDKLPLELRDKALAGFENLYMGDQSEQERMISRAESSPLYTMMMQGQERGNEAIMQNAAMTGGFRSGDVQTNLYDYNANFQNRALLSAYDQQLQGLQSFANPNLNTEGIASSYSGIGRAQGQGEVAAGQATQAGEQAKFNAITGAAGTLINRYDPDAEGGYADKWLASDVRLKDNIRHVGVKNGMNWYSWTWNDEAKSHGLSGNSEGVMAHEIFEVHPEAVGFMNGNLVVNYSQLGVM